MVPAVFDQTTIDVAAGDYVFRASGSVEKFAGYLAAYRSGKEDMEKGDDAEAEGKRLPRVTENEILKLATPEANESGETALPVRSEQHFTEPPPRYTEATLVKELEEKGIGRPSTYAAIISTIVEREYVTKELGKFTPTMLGAKVSVLLVKGSKDILNLRIHRTHGRRTRRSGRRQVAVETSSRRILRSIRKRFSFSTCGHGILQNWNSY